MSKPLPLEFLSGPIVDGSGRPLKPFVEYIQRAVEAPLAAIAVRSPAPATSGAVGQIQPGAVVAGRSEGIGTTLGNFNSAGKLQGAGVGFTVDNVPDGANFQRTTPNQVTGAGRAFNALDANNRLANSFHSTGVNVSSTPTAATVLSNNGSVTSISIAASSNQFAAGAISYNSGSVDPGTSGTTYVWAADPTFSGGAIPYNFSNNPQNQTAAEGNVLFGKIVTVSGSTKTGGGNTGGTGGGAGGRGFVL